MNCVVAGKHAQGPADLLLGPELAAGVNNPLFRRVFVVNKTIEPDQAALAPPISF
jgi:hypothetical protein